MPAPKTTTWKIEPHTQVKHVILRKYLLAWFPILSSTNGRILVVDGFAGPGVYDGGEPGSPIIAIDAFRDNERLRTRDVSFMFIEEDSNRIAELQRQINAKYPPAITNKVSYYHGKFDDTMAAVLDALDEQGHQMAPAFAFVDPFGFSDTPISMLGRIMRQDKCEILINFMHGFVQRFINDPDPAVAQHYDGLFGTSDWRGLATTTLPSKERERRIHDLYQTQLQRNGARYVRSFRLRNKFNQTEYFLFFATNHWKGLDVMKQAMWGADPTGAYDFSDYTDSTSPVLFTMEPDFAPLKQAIMNQFSGKIATVQEIEMLVVTNTPYCSTHYKRVLTAMEKTGEIECLTPELRKQRFKYPNPAIRLRFA